MADRQDFLDEVTEQISYKPLRPSIRRELEEHILDRMDEYVTQGASPNEAERQVIKTMGDPVAIGVELNTVHQVQQAPALAAATCLLLLLGFFAAAFMRQTPEQFANGCFYYLPGLVMLFLISWKGYPLAIRHGRLILIFTGFLAIAQPILIFSARYGHVWIWGSHILGYFTLLLLGPSYTLLLYRLRRHGAKAVVTILALCGGAIAGCSLFSFGITAAAILLLTLAGTLIFMIRRSLFGAASPAKRKLCLSALAGTLLISGLFFTSPYQRERAAAFVKPQDYAFNVWTDAYNGVLIQELLSRTPLTGGLKLTPEEMMDYGTGDWYFTPQNPAQDDFPRYIHYDESNVTLWNILPQHYHNNYLIAVCIFLYGWLPGLALTTLIALFYLLLFSCVAKIHGGLASSLAFSSGLCLLFQGIFYLLGNFGYQYATFPNLPLVSEGKISILFNMALLGFIFSAYRYDKVITEPEYGIHNHSIPSP